MLLPSFFASSASFSYFLRLPIPPVLVQAACQKKEIAATDVAQW